MLLCGMDLIPLINESKEEVLFGVYESIPWIKLGDKVKFGVLYAEKILTG